MTGHVILCLESHLNLQIGEDAEDDEMPRRRRKRGDGEGESLDDMLKSVPHNEAAEEGEEEDDADLFDADGVRIPSGMRSIS